MSSLSSTSSNSPDSTTRGEYVTTSQIAVPAAHALCATIITSSCVMSSSDVVIDPFVDSEFRSHCEPKLLCADSTEIFNKRRYPLCSIMPEKMVPGCTVHIKDAKRRSPQWQGWPDDHMVCNPLTTGHFFQPDTKIVSAKDYRGVKKRNVESNFGDWRAMTPKQGAVNFGRASLVLMSDDMSFAKNELDNLALNEKSTMSEIFELSNATEKMVTFPKTTKITSQWKRFLN